MDSLCEDLLDWKTIYVAGRMHKPVRIIRQDPRVLLANQVNLASVLRVALLSLPEEFSEVELWEQVAGVSYMGGLESDRVAQRRPETNKRQVILGCQYLAEKTLGRFKISFDLRYHDSERFTNDC